MRRFFIATFLSIFIPVQVSASVMIASLLPNPIGDDTLGEYIELRNTGCSAKDISLYTLSDESGKTYVIPSGTSIESFSNRIFPYSETKIALNNSGNESVYLKDNAGTLIDKYAYSGTQKDNVVLSLSLDDEACPLPETPPPEDVHPPHGDNPPSESDTGSSLIPENTETSSGVILSGTTSPEAPISPESTQTGSTISEEGGISGTGGEAGSALGGLGDILTESGNIVDVPSPDVPSPDVPSPDVPSPDFASGADMGLENDSFTGESVPYYESGVLIPLELFYDDSDANGKIDTLEITYPYALTGLVYTGSIAFYSNTGGFSNTRILTQTGFVQEGFLSGNILILKILEGDRQNSTLKINNTPTSDLRLKSSGDLGFRSLGGQIPEAFFLTTSFGSYKNVSKKSQIRESTVLSLPLEEGVSSGEILPIMAETIFSHIPDISLTLQSPTNVTFSGDIFICTRIDCRINITLEPLFASGFSMKDVICSFKTEQDFIVDADCNPTTYYFTQSGSIEVLLSSKKNPLEKRQKLYVVEWKPLSNPAPSVGVMPNAPLLDFGKPVPIIELDTKWKEYYFQNGEHALICYTYTCSVNFTAEKSYDPEGSVVRYLWIYGANEISTSKDPGSRKYGIGDHEIILRVIDEAGNSDQIRYILQVLGPKPKEEKKKIEKILKSSKNTEKIIASEILKPKKPKKIKMTFFSPPTLVLQGRTGEKNGENSYRCRYKTKPICSMNFTLKDTLRGYEYIWKLDGEQVHTGSNPLAWKLGPGRHTVTVETYRKGEVVALDMQNFSISVSAEPKKPKKGKTSKKISSKNPVKTSLIPETYATEISPQENSTSSGIGFLIFGSGLFLTYFLRRKKII